MDTLELIKLSKTGDKEARDLLVTQNVGLVWSIVRRFAGRGHELEDLFQIGSIGLIKAIDKFDLSYEVKFSTYAVPMITGEIKRFLRDDGIIKVSRSLKEIAVKVKITREILNNRLNREPTIEELSIEMEVATEDIVMALESNTEVESLYKTIYQGDGNAIFLIDKLEQVQDDHESVVDKLAIQEILDTLEPKEQDIIKLRYFMNRTQSDIAKKLGISQVQVSRLEKKILRTMREKLIG
ncbi:RNA polymerase sporulation-specific sigma factor [Anaerosporobacter mobilis DSM 15930]|jgi:RNA polymerase sporulation-specific sigma factor|uniref:RNA polymerase sigma factor n=1 Tax=Anaerosporobacter mobilis DSM 15930 TaxID=1120996 RepID=A0A1M7KTL1_9FIRM|nr:RNA polymerase sporulation sigma factor SigF [Anaerosporobacter mobilis]MBS5932440.1 RNA polymerase sporulation sigma factor SigF [Clostridiales bacterium]SHM68557.1 RNA polymerase sporulation-specific sigma factor [Anaerosporobacter mobilis DSM 15930]